MLLRERRRVARGGTQDEASSSGLSHWGMAGPLTSGNLRRHLSSSRLAVTTEPSTWVQARDTAKHPATHRTAPTTDNDLAPNVNGAKVKVRKPDLQSWEE